MAAARSGPSQGEEVANMIVYICSEQASATTGSALRVDGGVVRFSATAGSFIRFG
ncbi:SDR family oxidoreductase [Rhizobium sp. CNPSo 4039]|uniref:SDR family oxidoreductase n=1 Tax=Rhizobium sp. CNPSo 4039 TaxID=3021409 RepID=UPI00254AD5F3|nr:SDR family oxidoreductase [Rhizobium sp. CNPSo 4039]MDK4715849.1 SDR family oxidoreductase [Rhizobium sp. CNPSo 4039]